MNKIPSAEEFLDIGLSESGFYFEGKMRNIAKRKLIEFAKLHCQAAIKMCIESAPSGSSTDAVSYEDVVESLKDCYPLDNIK